MLRGLFSRLSFLRRRGPALSHRSDQLKSDSDRRRERWTQVIAEHQKPRGPHTDTASPRE